MNRDRLTGTAVIWGRQSSISASFLSSQWRELAKIPAFVDKS